MLTQIFSGSFDKVQILTSSKKVAHGLRLQYTLAIVFNRSGYLKLHMALYHISTSLIAQALQ